jgi:isopentenyl diphosphate isomerase/L-lactate dehydrogenase-like FMN-dependent dehydrogenase
MPEFLSLHEIVRAAKRNLPQTHWDYLVGGAETETTLKRNRAALDALAFRPRVLNDVSDVHVSRELFGHRLRIPVVLPPIGSIQIFEAGGGRSVAEAADAFGTLMILSSVCLPDFETVARVGAAPKVFQLYLMGDVDWMDDHISRAIEAGYSGFCLTADTQVYSRRERDVLKRWSPPSGRRAGEADFGYQAKMTWETVRHIKEKFPIPLWLKGVNTADDARRAVECGVDVVYVSNHGGRQLDHGRGCIEALPEVVEAVDRRVPVIVDGGFLRGTDVVKALCLGADGVGAGRLEALAMAAGGARAVVRALEILEHELRTCMALLGVARLEDLDPSLLQPATAIGRAHVLSAFPLLEEDY